MTPIRRTALALLLSTLTARGLLAADPLVVVEAESGTLGSDYVSASAGAVTYITPGTDYLSTSAPGSAAKVATCTVTFPQAGTYNLYLRFRIGPAGGADDSLYYASAFGSRNPTLGDDWITANFLAGVGYSASGDAVDGGGSAGIGVWKWLRFSSFSSGESGVSFTVPAGQLTQTFQIGARENGLDVDQIAFGLAGRVFTVGDLENARPVVLSGQTFSAFEGSSVGTVVGTLLASDPDGDAIGDWAIVGGTGAAAFAVDASTGQLTVADPAALDAATTPSYTLLVTAGDGIFASAPVEVSIDVASLSMIAVQAPGPGVYHVGQSLGFTVVLDRAMYVDTNGGVPSLGVAIGSTVRDAAYVAGSGSASLTFSYTIQAGDNDADGIELVSPIAPNGGTIRDAVGDDVGLGFSLPPTSGIFVDTAPPDVPVIAGNSGRVFNGTAESGSTISLYLDGVLSATTVAGPSGVWSCELSPVGIVAGSHDYVVTATATDAADNESAPSASYPITIVIDPNAPVVVQAESGVLGSDYLMLAAGGAGYITPATDLNTSTPQSPGVAGKVATYTVFFPQAGTYNLYARVRVGSSGASDDSFYYGSGFGSKSLTDANAWISVNNIYNVGYAEAAEYLAPLGSVWGAGPAGTGIWKWLQLSGSTFYDAGPQFVVPEGQLTQTFQIGSRENGLDIDQLAFGLDGVYYTVAQLDAGAAGSTTPPPPPYTPDHPPLATGKTKFLGCEYGANSAPNFEHYFNQVVPGNGGKWGSIEASRDVMNWTDFDAAYRVAKTNGFKFRYHVLVWGSQQPSWMESLSDAEQLAEIHEWFAAVAAHTVDGEVIDPDWIEVVNEPLHAPPDGTGHGNYMKALGGSGTTGWDWILNAFRLARQYFPGKKLMMNEYSVTNDGNSMARYVQIINLLKAEGLIDLVGFQGHSFEIRGTSTSTLTANLETLAATGLPIIVTEMDIDDGTALPQLGEYQRIFPLFWEHPSVIGVTLWGYRPGMWRPDANLVLNSGAEKPAMLWLKDYVRNNLPVVVADQRFHVFAGAVNGTVVGTVQATDADGDAVLQDWSIKDGSAASAFSIEAATGRLVLSNAGALDFGTNPSYSLRVKVGDGIGHGVATTLTILPGVAPSFTSEPTDQLAFVGGTVQFGATAAGAPAPALHWQRSVDDGASWSDLVDDATFSGCETGALSVAVDAAMDGDRFRCVADNGAPTSAVSAGATLAVLTRIASYDQWAALNGVSGGADADPEGCGLSNFGRYAFGQPAHGPVDAVASVSVVTVAGEDRLQVAFTRQAAATDLEYVVEASVDLVDWSEQVEVVAPGDPSAVLVVDTVSIDSVPRRFLRVRARTVSAP